MLNRQWLNREEREKPLDFTAGQLLASILVNLILLLVCFLAYQTAYRIEFNRQQPYPFLQMTLPH
uniref:Uncharacterized protein n=1 Tax=Cyanothece sp. (strain PCC 7425 / ATCC 29141) TaxID=395961 RepID=B8HX37_CYAP4